MVSAAPQPLANQLDAADGHRIEPGTAANAERVYRGAWGIDGRIAYVEGPTGISALAHDCERARLFEWGTHSPGTVELAAAIVSDLGGKKSRRTASQAQIRRLSELLAVMPHDGFALRAGEIDRWIRSADHCGT